MLNVGYGAQTTLADALLAALAEPQHASAAIRKMIEDRQITGGMIPKVECAIQALADGVEKVPIINGKRRHAILLELFTDRGIGTEVIE